LLPHRSAGLQIVYPVDLMKLSCRFLFSLLDVDSVSDRSSITSTRR
jgi:hypothetical protein